MEKFMKYNHLSLEQRHEIQYYKLIKKLSNRKIAKLIGVHHSTVSREIKRNSVTLREPLCEKYIVKYEVYAANNKYLGRRAKNREKATPEIIEIIKTDIQKFNSITTISGKWHLYIKNFPSSTTIYKWIKCGIIKISKLYKSAFKLKQTNNKGKSQSHDRDVNTKSIHERPLRITNRLSQGHWELDLIESAGNGGYIISFIERITRFAVTKYIDRKIIANVNPFINKIIKIYNVNSITTDNGNEFLQLHKLKKFNRQLEIYYCESGKPQQKGQVEWFNKQMRRFFKKHEPFDAKSTRRLKHYTKVINEKYLNVLNYHSPSHLEYLIKKQTRLTQSIGIIHITNTYKSVALLTY